VRSTETTIELGEAALTYVDPLRTQPGPVAHRPAAG
jgi:hypothetical protein